MCDINNLRTFYSFQINLNKINTYNNAPRNFDNFQAENQGGSLSSYFGLQQTAGSASGNDNDVFASVGAGT